MVKEIVTDGDPVLRKKADEVQEGEFDTDELKALVRDMSDTLRTTEYGVAIAAPQIGVSKRIFVVRGFIVAHKLRKEEGADSIPDAAFINPTITRASRKKERFEEGCLSVPKKFGTIVRSEKVEVSARTPDGTAFEVKAEGLLAEIFQHEIDHLNGVLFIDEAEDVYIHEPTTPNHGNRTQ